MDFFDFPGQVFPQNSIESSPTHNVDDAGLMTTSATPAYEHTKRLEEEQSPASAEEAADLDEAVIEIEETPITRNRRVHVEIAESHNIKNFPEDIVDLIAMLCGHDTLMSLAELDVTPAVHWMTFVHDEPASVFWHSMGGITTSTGVFASDEEFDAQLLSDIRYDWQIPLPDVVVFPEHVQNRKYGESCPQRFNYESMCVWFEEHVGPIRGLYHFFRHVCDLPVEEIVTMTPGEVLCRLNSVRRGFDELYAACFYGLNGFACSMFEEMRSDEVTFVGKWEDAISGTDPGYFGTDNAHKNRFKKVKSMWGNDIFAYIYAHGNWKLARDISRQYGRQDYYGIVWRTGVVESIFVNSLGVLLDTVNLDPWEKFLEERFLDHFVNQGSPLLALSDLFLDATDAERFHKMVSLLELTGSVGVRRLVEQRFDSEFGVKQLKLLEKTLYENEWLRASVTRQDWEGWQDRNGRNREPRRYPYEGATMNLWKRSDVLSAQRWLHVRNYLEEPKYFEEHSRLHTKVFRVVADMQ